MWVWFRRRTFHLPRRLTSSFSGAGAAAAAGTVSSPPPPSPAPLSLDLHKISELISGNDWTGLRHQIGPSISPSELLRRLIAGVVAGESPATGSFAVFRLLRWCRSHDPIFPHLPLPLHCRLLQSLAADKHYSEARSEIHHIVLSDLHPYTSILHAISISGAADPRRRNHAAASILADMLVLEFSRQSKPSIAFETFLRAGDYGYRSSVHSCNALLSSMAKVAGAGSRKAELIYREMNRRKIVPDLFTFNAVINCFCKAGKMQRAADVMEDMKSWGIRPSAATYNTLIDGHFKSGAGTAAGVKMFKVESLMKEMIGSGVAPNVVTFNTLIDGCSKSEGSSAAARFFAAMKEQGVTPNVRTYNSMINGLCRDGKVDEAAELLRKMEEVSPDVATYNAIANGLCKTGRLAEAMELLEEMKRSNRVVPNVVTYNTLVDGHCRYGSSTEVALGLLEKMEDGVSPDISTYNSLVLGFCKSGRIGECAKVLDEMRERGLKADLITYNTLIGALCKGGKVRRGMKLLDEMLEVGLRPSYLTYNALIEGFCAKGDFCGASEMRMRMEKGRKPANVVTYNLLIRCLCGKGELEEANRLLNEMLERGLVPNRNTYDIIRDEMVEKGFVPDIDGHLWASS